MFILSYRKPTSVLVIFSVLLPLLLLATPALVYASDGSESKGGFIGALQRFANTVTEFVGNLVKPIGSLFTTIAQGLGLYSMINTVKGWFQKDQVVSMSEMYPDEQARQAAMIRMAFEQNIERIDVQDPNSAYVLVGRGEEPKMLLRDDLVAIGYTTASPSTTPGATNSNGGYVPRGDAVYEAVVTEIFPRNLVQGALVNDDVKYYYDVVEVVGGQRRIIETAKFGSAPIPWERIENEGLYGHNVIIQMDLSFELPTGVVNQPTDLMFNFVGHVDTSLTITTDNYPTAPTTNNYANSNNRMVLGNGDLYNRLPGRDLWAMDLSGGLISDDIRNRFRSTVDPYQRTAILNEQLMTINVEITNLQSEVAHLFHQTALQNPHACLVDLQREGHSTIINALGSLWGQIQQLISTEAREERERLLLWHGEMGTDCNGYFLFNEALRTNAELANKMRELDHKYELRTALMQELMHARNEASAER